MKMWFCIGKRSCRNLRFEHKIKNNRVNVVRNRIANKKEAEREAYSLNFFDAYLYALQKYIKNRDFLEK